MLSKGHSITARMSAHALKKSDCIYIVCQAILSGSENCSVVDEIRLFYPRLIKSKGWEQQTVEKGGHNNKSNCNTVVKILITITIRHLTSSRTTTTTSLLMLVKFPTEK